jgi:tellurite resistance protein TerC
MVRRLIIHTYLQAKRLVIIVVGFTVLLIGIIMIALPGPAILVIPIGLTILATEFVWAKLLLKKFKDTANQINSPKKARLFFNRIRLKVGQSVSQFFGKKPVPEKET